MANPFDEPNPFDDEPKPSEHLSESNGVKRLELHKVAPDTSDPEAAPVKSKDEMLLDMAKQYISPKSSSGAFAEGVTKGSTLGFGDELYGAIGADSKRNEQAQRTIDDTAEAKRRGEYEPNQAPELPSFTTYQLKRAGQPTESVVRAAKSPNEAQGNEDNWKQAYQQARDSMRADYDTAEKTHPVLFGAGELAGSLAVPLPGPGKAKGAAKVLQYGLTGAGVGAANALGNSNAADAGDNALDALKGGAGGAAVGGALGGVAAKLDPWLEQKAARRAYKALDPSMKTISEGLGPDVAAGRVPVSEAFGEMERLGRRALDEGIIPEGLLERFANSETINDRAVAKLKDAGVLKGAVVDAAQDTLAKQGAPTPVSLGRLATNIEQEAAQAKIDGKQDLARKLLKQARDIRQTIVDRASAGFADPAAQALQDAEKFKTGLQGQVDYGAPLARREAQTITARLAKEQAEHAIENGLGPDDLEMFKAVKDRYGDLSTLAQTSAHGAIRGFRNQSSSLGSKVAGGAAAHAATGPLAIPLAIAAGAGHEAANHRGAAGLARTLSNASQGNMLLAPAVTGSLSPWESLLGLNPDEEK